MLSAYLLHVECKFVIVKQVDQPVALIITAGSLAVSVTDMTAPVVGSSGGVYALVSAHLANVVMVGFCICHLQKFFIVDLHVLLCKGSGSR